MVGLPARQQGRRGRLGQAEVRQLQHQNQGLLGTELQVILASALVRRDVFGRRGVRVIGASRRRHTCWLLLAMLALTVGSAAAQTADEQFRTALAGLSAASYPDREAIITTLSEGGHPS